MEDPELTKLGSSLQVACVQELAKNPIAAIPPRYLRPDQEPTNATSPLSIPVIDLQKLLSTSHHDDDGDLKPELDSLHAACRDWGFFQLMNHGVSESLIDKVKAEVEGFFNLPIEEKRKYWQRPGEMEGFGQAFVVSEEQKLDWGDLFYTTILPKHLRKPHLFPRLPLPLRETLEEYSAALKGLSMNILDLMAEALRMDTGDMKVLFDEGWQKFRMNYYPPYAFIINIGDTLEILSNGMYKSVEHRATVNSDKERISFATFVSPKLDGDLGPAPSLLINTQAQPKYRRIGVADYFKGYFRRELAGKSYVDVMRILPTLITPKADPA
ncbi:unnamed protein product [Linum tenue]|uniref:Fe2OG dioxygenase domain-containing protein n=1 Tax=Linum tenue TaxID=586396 RepID=A0AAV0N0T9_9ROSI|nr:unnamed protein product [Linum tenue]